MDLHQERWSTLEVANYEHTACAPENSYEADAPEPRSYVNHTWVGLNCGVRDAQS